MYIYKYIRVYILYIYILVILRCDKPLIKYFRKNLNAIACTYLMY